MKLPFKITRNRPRPTRRATVWPPPPEEFQKALTEALGIPVDVDYDAEVERTMEAWKDRAERPSRPHQPIFDRAMEQIIDGPYAGMVSGFQSESACCDLNARDGMIFVSLNSAGINRLVDKLPAYTGRAGVTVYCVDEHQGTVSVIGMEVEALKKLMNRLPHIIQEAERQRDKALEIVANA